MPKKLKGILILIFAGILLSIPSFAIASEDLSIQDLVLADLSIRNYLNNVSVSLFEGKDDRNLISINQDHHWLPASTVKTFAAMYAFKKISQHELDPSSPYQIESVNVVPTELETPDLPILTAGQYVPLDRLIKQMITQSDNTAFNVMLDILGRKNITNYIHSIGLTHSAVGSKLNLDETQEQSEFDVAGYGINTTTAEDYSKAFVLIKDRKIPGANELYSIFKSQRINNMIPLFLPKTVTVAHKPGDLDPLFHDGGIVSSGKNSYVISIFTNLGDPGIVAHISHLIYTKDLSLVGSKIRKNISELPNNYIDPLLLSQAPSNVLGAATQNSEPFPITASDLGIKASDLLTSSPKQHSLPSIPSNSPLFFAQPLLQVIQEGLNPTQSLSSSLTEANILIAQNKIEEATEILKDVEPRLSDLVKSEDMNDPQKQNDVQEISNIRFSLLGQELQKAKDLETKKELIKIIAKGATSEISKIQPVIPKAATSSNLSQKPLLGEVVNITINSVLVRSASGQIIEIPSDSIVKTRSTTESKAKDTKITDIRPGTSIALLGTSDGGKFIPSFVLTKLDRQLIAPQPVNVLKVDTKNKVMVVSENGNPVQVNISSQTIIKGSGTNVSLESIKPGDTLIIRGQKVNAVPNKEAPETEKTDQQQPNQKSGPSSSQTPQTPGSIQQSPSGKSQPQSQGSQPKIIQGTSIQVIEKKQDVKVESPKTPAVSSPKKEKHKGKKER